MVKYINFKTRDGVETADEINSEDYSSLKDFRKASRELLYEYNLSVRNGGSFPQTIRYYLSSRCTNDWKQRD